MVVSLLWEIKDVTIYIMAVRPVPSRYEAARGGTGLGSSAAVTARGVHRDGEGELIRFQLDIPVDGSAKVLVYA